MFSENQGCKVWLDTLQSECAQIYQKCRFYNKHEGERFSPFVTFTGITKSSFAAQGTENSA